MRILKFGGTSLANAECFFKVINILENTVKKEQISVVLSAPAKITNYLTSSIEENLSKNSTSINLNKAKTLFKKLIYNIYKQQNNFLYQKLLNIINIEFKKINKLLQKIHSIQKCPKNLQAIIICQGEILSIAIMKEILIARNHKITIINPIKKLFATGSYLDSEVDIKKSTIKILNMNIPENHIILMSGFIAGMKNKEIAVLGRNGSDYSAAILAACLRANSCEIWTDVNGVYTCDPKIIPKAQLLKYISYQEATELSYFGAKVIHPKTIAPLTKFNIPCLIKNTFNLQSNGTLISNYTDNHDIIKGITFLNNISILKILNNETNKTANPLINILSTLQQHNIPILLTVQASANQSINICIFDKDLKKTIKILEKELQIDLLNKKIKLLCVAKKKSILSIIGSNISSKKLIISNTLNVLSKFSMNTLTIVQGLSKNIISTIIDGNNITNVVKTVYNSIFNTKQIIEVFLIGIGGVGQSLLKQLQNQQPKLEKKHIKIKICGIANSKLLLTKISGICLNNWKESFKKYGIPFNFNNFIDIIKNNNFINPVIIDCSSAQNISNEYSNFLYHGFNIVTANKKANTSSIEYYKKIRKTALQSRKKFLYETNIGAGLPIIDNFQKLINSGDELIKFKGILSGSLSFIFGKLEEGMSLSEATAEAQKLGFTEPNPLEDLSGIDVARKLLILAREAGFNINLNDIQVESVLTSEILKDTSNSQNVIKQLSKIDQLFYNRSLVAKKSGKVLRFVGTIQKKGICKVKIEAVDKNNPLYDIKNGENALAFYSKYYNPIPLIIRGYGAGNNVTAAGIFSDVLRIIQ